MSDHVELIRRWLDAFNARDAEAMVAVAHPDVVVRPMRIGVAGEYRGHDGVRAWIAALGSIDAAVHADSARVLPGRGIVVEGDLAGLDARFVALYEVRDERIVSVRAYMSDRELLEQLGLLDPVEDRH